MISIDHAAALILIALILGIGISWAYFRDHVRHLEAQGDADAAEIERLTEDLDQATARALDAEASLELVLGEGDRDPLTAPVAVIRGGR